MKNFVATLVVVLAVIFNIDIASAQKAEIKPRFEFLSITGWDSSYVLGAGPKVSKDGEGMFSQLLQATDTETGIYGSVWIGQSDKNPGFEGSSCDEFDATIGWSGTFGHGAGTTTIDTSVAYFDLTNPKLFDGKGDLVDLAIDISWPKANDDIAREGYVLKRVPFVKIERLFGTDDSSFDGGVVARAGFRGDFGKDSAHVGVEWAIGYNSGVGGIEGYWTQAIVSPTWSLPKGWWLVIPRVHVAVPLDNYIPDTNYSIGVRLGRVFK